MKNKLHVENLKISFHTDSGKVQAVRNISFDLNEGETLAIVGESGSGKSVTSKAILGILAGNSIVEDGEIIYDGKDLLKINEDDFHKIRGDKIAMIFQDPMSSLNPIVKIGKQLTEAMILKGKARQKESRKAFNSYLGNLNKLMIAANPAAANELTRKCHTFNTFEYKHLEQEKSYNVAHNAAVEAISEIEAILFEIEKNGFTDPVYRTKRVAGLATSAVHTYVVNNKVEELKAAAKAAAGAIRRESKKGYNVVPASLKIILDILKEAVDAEAPNFFAMGYYLTFCKDPLPEMPVNELNVFLRKYLDDNFMLAFIEDTKKALYYSADKTCQNKAKAIMVLEQYKAVFEKEQLVKNECYAALRAMAGAVSRTIDPLAINKDSMVYTFAVGIKTEIGKYFTGIVRNVKEAERYERQMAKYNKIVAKGKEPDGQVIAASIIDLEGVKKNIVRQINTLIDHYRADIAALETRDFDGEAVAVIDYLKACASGVVHKVTKRMAKEKAIKLMEEVGIAEPRRRFNQYPFEFSGGMRQRIVIAIALAADPDILICDEPTTALDVTIQSQILELINDLKKERNLSVIFITHDLGVVANMADRIAVMYAGKIVEYGTSADVFYEAAHPYTWALLSSMPDLDTNEKLEAIPGTPPNMIYPPVGDAFAARNKYAMKIDFELQPPMFQITDTHYAATWLLHPDAPKVDRPKIITDRIARMRMKMEAKDAE